MTMAKIHPNPLKNSRSCGNYNDSSSCASDKDEIVYTLWMKSLVFHGKGCTVFNSRGDVVFRVDNYQQRCSRKVFLMDSNGKVLFSINRKKMGICGCWEGFRWSDSSSRPWFQVMRICKTTFFMTKDICLRVALRHGENNNPSYCYRIIGLEGKSALKIVDFSGQLLAEAVQKQSAEGVNLGEDVLTLMVQSEADQSLIMALVTVFGLINHKL